MKFEDIPQEIVEQYGLETWGNLTIISKPMFISIKNAKIIETLYTYEFQSTGAYVIIYKEVFNVHTTIF